MRSEPYLIETRVHGDSEWEERWMVPPPPIGVRYRVTAEAWIDSYRVRLIHEWQEVT